jgi:dihydrofolate reductase
LGIHPEVSVVEVVYYVASSVDGFIATPDGGVEWLSPFESSGEDYGYADFYRSVDALMMGAHTYEQALGFEPWPYPDKPVRVFTSRSLESAGSNVVLLDQDPAAVVATLGRAGCSRLWLVGGGMVAGAFESAGLIDTYIVAIMPVVLGAGVPLLGGHARRSNLALVDSVRFPNGVMQNTYRPSRDAQQADRADSHDGVG